MAVLITLVGRCRSTEDLLFAHLRWLSSPLRCCPPWGGSLVPLGVGLTSVRWLEGDGFSTRFGLCVC